MPEFIENLLTGIRRWVNGKIADIDTAIDNKQDILTPGDNIEITSGGTINVTGITVPVASDFDIKDLADSDDLRSEWSTKQDALTAGDNIEITSGGTINVTGITGVIDAELEGLTLVISSNINELDGRLIDVENNKQDVISDLSTIRSGAALGATALQSVPSEYVTDSELASELANYATTSALTSGLATKQDALTAGDNIEITSGGTINVTGITGVIESELEDLTLVISSNINELDERLVNVESGKQDTISDLDTIRSGAALGATALQSVPSEYVTDSELASELANYTTTSALTSGLATKQDVLTAGDNIEITSGGTINVTGITGVIDAELEGLTLVISSNINELDGRLIDVENNKQDVISDLDTIRSGATLGATALQSVPSEYVTDSELASELANYATTSALTSGLATKQDVLTAGDNIEIDSTGTISATGVTSATEQILENMSFVISSNINELHSRLIDVESGKQDVLTAGDNIEIDSAGTISCTITSTSQLDNDSDFVVGEELSYSEHALFYSGDDVVATGMVSRVGSVVTLYVAHADVVDGWRDIYYRLPYEPASSYISTVNSRGIYESDGIHYKVTFDYQTVGSVVYPVLRLNHYINGEIANWEYGQIVSFKVDYITSE